jgi:aspartate aminotransferase-like enzyme
MTAAAPPSSLASSQVSASTSPARPPGQEAIRFFLPGPSYVLEDTRAALTGPVVGHRSAHFKAVYVRLAARLPAVFRTAGDVYVATCSSTLMMESALLSTVARDVLHLTNGSFSERWHAIGLAVGRAADRVAFPWGQAVDPDTVRAALRRKRYEAVTLVHNETSTGVISPLAEIARVIREESDALVLADTVSSLGGAAVETDAWGLDVVLAGVQKALAAPPGLVLATLSERAAERAARLPHRGFYTDLLRYRAQHREGGSTITTPAVNLVWALDRQLDRVMAEGVAARWERHAALAAQTAAWAAERGLAYASAAGARSPTVSCLGGSARMPAPELVQRLAARGFTVAGGYGEWKASTFRIGHMGEVRAADLADLFTAIDDVLAGS